MKLEKIKIKNFRGYKGEYEINLNSFSAFIGKNDAGKSSVFDALDIFFNGSKPDLMDLNICRGDGEIKISCVFSAIPEEIIIDDSANTSLKDEFLLNKDGYYEVAKVFKCTEKTITSSPEVVIRAHYPTKSGLNDLHNLKIDELKSRGESLGVTVSDKRVSSFWRKAIWNNSSDLELKEIDLKVEEFDSKSKKIYTNLESEYPLFFLFKSDRQTSDSDSEAKDPIQLAVTEAQKEFIGEIESLKKKIQERVEGVAARALEKLKDMDPNLASKLQPKLKSNPKWTFDYKLEDERGVALNKRGSGTRRLVLLNFFRAEAERKTSNTEGSVIYAIEEPETSQHPNNQRIIINSLLSLVADSKRQVLISTHSPELLEVVPRDSIVFIYLEDDEPVVVYGAQALILAADSLGILSNQKFGSAKIIVLVESISDCVFLEHAINTLKNSGNISFNLDDKKILTLPLGGRPGIEKWIDEDKAKNLGLKYAVMIDSDRTDDNRANKTINEEKVEKWGVAGIIAFCTRKREIENYIDQSIANCTYGDFDDAKQLISEKNNISKREIMDTFWTKMTAEQIINTGKYINGEGDEKNEICELINSIGNL